MGKKMKIASGIIKGTIGVLTFGGSFVLNSAFKAATGGFGAPSGSGTAIDDARRSSQYWIDEAINDFNEAKNNK